MVNKHSLRINFIEFVKSKIRSKLYQLFFANTKYYDSVYFYVLKCFKPIVILFCSIINVNINV